MQRHDPYAAHGAVGVLAQRLLGRTRGTRVVGGKVERVRPLAEAVVLLDVVGPDESGRVVAERVLLERSVVEVAALVEEGQAKAAQKRAIDARLDGRVALLLVDVRVGRVLAPFQKVTTQRLAVRVRTPFTHHIIMNHT